ncbi:MAG: NRDE family protein [Candidatus Binatia bacterium]
MCTLALYFQEFKEYPLIVAANRDEFYARPSASPQVLLEEPLVFGGKDLLAGGTWLGVNEHGLLAGILNRRSNTEKTHGTVRSRGSLCLDILKVKEPAQACALLMRERGSAYQAFNLLFANAEEAYVAYNVKGNIEFVKLAKGVHVLSNTSIYNPRSAKVDHAHNLFSHAGKQVHDDLDASFMTRLFRRGTPIWDQPSFIRLFKGILNNHMLPKDSKDPRNAICVHTSNYGTVSSTILFYSRDEKRFFYHHAPAAPCRSDYEKLLSVEAT